MNGQAPIVTPLVPRRLPRALTIVLGMVRFEAWVTGIAGGFAVLIGLLSLAVAPSQWPFAAIATMIGAGSLGLAAILFALRRGLEQLSIRSRLRGIAIHALMLPPGIALYIVSQPVVNRPGTDGPFADGGQGLIGLLGMTYPTVSIAAITILLLHRATRQAFHQPT